MRRSKNSGHDYGRSRREDLTEKKRDISSFETQLAACNNVQQQYWWPLELGYTEAESGLADYQSQMEAAGIETMKEAAQKQLDDYIASLK